MNVVILLCLAVALVNPYLTNAACPDWPVDDKAYGIQIVDSVTGRGVPCVRLATVNNIHYFTDSGGYVAYLEPGVMNQGVYFTVQSDGYEYPKGALFGYRGFPVNATFGGHTVTSIDRMMISERLYRLTGGGIYRDSCILDKPVPLNQPLLDSRVYGQDSIMTAVFNGEIHWFWGDTNRPEFPLGNFGTTGATSLIPKSKGGTGLNPDEGVNFNYYQNDAGFVKPMTDVPGPGPTWIGGLTSIDDGMFTFYSKISKPHMGTGQWGIMKWSSETNQFDTLTSWPLDSVFREPVSGSHTFLKTDAASNITYVYFSQPFPFVRCPATQSALVDLSSYEAWSPLVAGATLTPTSAPLERGPNGDLVYGWKKNTQPVFQNGQSAIIQSGAAMREEFMIQIRDVKNTTCYIPNFHGGSVYFNEYRQKYIMIAGEDFGQGSFLGELWYTEADAPEGPWIGAIKIVTHSTTGMSFYNPVQHEMFDSEDGKLVYFSGTFVNTFTQVPPIPRYNYNNIMHRLDLSTFSMTPVANQEACEVPNQPAFKPWEIVLIVVGCFVALLGVVCGVATCRRRRQARLRDEARSDFQRNPFAEEDDLAAPLQQSPHY